MWFLCSTKFGYRYDFDTYARIIWNMELVLTAWKVCCEVLILNFQKTHCCPSTIFLLLPQSFMWWRHEEWIALTGCAQIVSEAATCIFERSGKRKEVAQSFHRTSKLKLQDGNDNYCVVCDFSNVADSHSQKRLVFSTDKNVNIPIPNCIVLQSNSDWIE